MRENGVSRSLNIACRTATVSNMPRAAAACVFLCELQSIRLHAGKSLDVAWFTVRGSSEWECKHLEVNI